MRADNPEKPVVTRELALRGLIPSGSPSPDSLPVIAGLLFDDLTESKTIHQYARITSLRFSRPVETSNNDPLSTPWDPFIYVFSHCVLDSGLSDQPTTVGGQFEYELRNCTVNGPLNLVFPQAVTIENSVFRAPVQFSRDAYYAGIERLWIRYSSFIGKGGIGLELSVVDDADVFDNRFEGFETAVLHRGGGKVNLFRNRFLGPGRYAVHSNGEIGLLGNRIVGFDVGVLFRSDENSSFSSRGNGVEQCTSAGWDVIGGYVSCEGDTILSSGAGMILSAKAVLTLRNNVILGCKSDGMRLQLGQGIIESNVVGRCGGHGIAATVVPLYDNPVRLLSDTSYLNRGAGFSFARVSGNAIDEVSRNIAHGNGHYGFELTSPDSLILSCNDWFDNTLGATFGVDPSSSDLAVDPMFCDLSHDDVHLPAGSFLAQADDCGLIGALGVGCDMATPVLVERFTAWRRPGGTIVVGWLVNTQFAATLRVERAEDVRGPWTAVEGRPEYDGQLLTLVDALADPSRAHDYRLLGESGQVLATTHIDASTFGGEFVLEASGTNPGPGPFTIRFQTPVGAALEIDVFDLQGRRAARIASGRWPAGTHEVQWSGRDGGGRLRAGLHLVRYRFPGGQAIRRLVLIH